MIQDIEPYRFDNAFRIKKPVGGDVALLYQDNKILLKKEENQWSLPLFEDFGDLPVSVYDEAEYVFSIDNQGFYLTPNNMIPDTDEYELHEINVLRDLEPLHMAFAGITGSQLKRWKENHMFCGRCASKMESSDSERALICSNCGHIEYPKISPAVIVAITNGNRLLMTKYAHGNYQHYSLVAGFVEFGETFEEAVRREVMEEVGLLVKNIRYYKSQPWAFSDTEMIGFFAELDGEDKITIQESELSEAKWFEREEIPESPSQISISYDLIELFRNQNYKKYMK